MFEEKEKIKLPTTFEQINKIILNNLKKSEFKNNSSVKIQNYTLDKNLRKLVKNGIFLELTEKEIELIELLNNKSFIKKKKYLQAFGGILVMQIHIP